MGQPPRCMRRSPFAGRRRCAIMANATQMRCCGCVCASQALVLRAAQGDISRRLRSIFCENEDSSGALLERSSPRGKTSSPTRPFLVSYTTLAFLLDYFFAARRVRVRYTALCNATRVINRIAAAA